MEAVSQSVLKLAIEQYEGIVKLQPRSVDNHLFLGRLYARNSDLRKAETEFKAAVKLDPNSGEAVTTLAYLEQKEPTPEPKPADGGPSPEVTMKFIQDTLNGIGPVSYRAYTRDDATGNDRTGNETSKVVADPDGCSIEYQWKTEFNRAAAGSGVTVFSLTDVRDVVVMPIEQELKDYETAENPAKSLEGLAWRLPSSPYVDPPVVVLKVRKTVLKFANDFEFLDEDMANR